MSSAQASSPTDDPRLSKASDILRYCDVTDDELRTKLEHCREGKANN